MMLLLILDVVDDPVFVGMGHRETTVTFLPTVKSREQTFLLNPNIGRDLDVFDEVRQRDGWMDTRENVNVIFDGIDPVQMRILVPNDAPRVAEELLPILLYQHPLPRLRGEHEVVIDLCESGHGDQSARSARRARI